MQVSRDPEYTAPPPPPLSWPVDEFRSWNDLSTPPAIYTHKLIIRSRSLSPLPSSRKLIPRVCARESHSRIYIHIYIPFFFHETFVPLTSFLTPCPRRFPIGGSWRSRINSDLIKDYGSTKIKINRALFSAGTETRERPTGRGSGAAGKRKGHEGVMSADLAAAANGLNYTKSDRVGSTSSTVLVEAYHRRMKRGRGQERAYLSIARLIVEPLSCPSYRTMRDGPPGASGKCLGDTETTRSIIEQCRGN